MKIFSFNIIYLIILIITIKSNQNITESKIKRVRACIVLQQKKFEENQELINSFLQQKSEQFKRSQNKILILSLAYCFNKITDDLAYIITSTKIQNININKLNIKDIYDFEKYNYDNEEMNKKVYDEFIPFFEVVYKEIIGKEEKKLFKNQYIFNIYFLNTKLFKFFLLYTLINTIIVFYIRIKNSSKYIDKTNSSENNKNDEEDEENLDNTKNTDDNKENNNHRKLKKKNRLGKVKKN